MAKTKAVPKKVDEMKQMAVLEKHMTALRTLNPAY